MARGWESKSVEEQIDLAQRSTLHAISAKPKNQVQVEILRRTEGIQLSRTRVMRELAEAHNPRYKAQLNKALEDLDAKLAAFGAGAG